MREQEFRYLRLFHSKHYSSIWDFITWGHFFFCKTYCSGLNKKAPPHVLKIFTTWVPTGGTVWERLKSAALVEKLSLKCKFWIFKTQCLSRFFLPHVCSQQWLQCHVWLPAAMLLAMMAVDFNPPQLWSPNKPFLLKLPLWYLITTIKI